MQIGTYQTQANKNERKHHVNVIARTVATRSDAGFICNISIFRPDCPPPDGKAKVSFPFRLQLFLFAIVRDR